MQVERNLVGYNEQLKRKALVGAQMEQRDKGGYTVTLSLRDELDELMSLSLLALELQKRFRAHAEEIYSKILDCLYDGNL